MYIEKYIYVYGEGYSHIIWNKKAPNHISLRKTWQVINDRYHAWSLLFNPPSKNQNHGKEEEEEERALIIKLKEGLGFHIKSR